MVEVNVADLPGLVGQELGISDWLEVSQDRVDLFAQSTGDDQWIHIDVARATREMGGTIAHGFLTLSLVPVMGRDILKLRDRTRGINYGCDKVRFTNSIKVGKRIRLRQKLLAVEPRGGGQQMRNQFTVEIENEDRPACVLESLMIVFTD